MRPSFIRLCSLRIYGYTCGMGLHTTDAAQNPPDCQHIMRPYWTAPPILDPEMDAPQNVPDTCVGPMTVGPAHEVCTTGVYYYFDDGNCDPLYPADGPHYRYPDFVYWWSLYEQGPDAIPDHGTGTTAVFTNNHGGIENVQFSCLGTVPGPPTLAWGPYSVGRQSNLYRVFEVVSLLPNDGCEVDDFDGDPNTVLPGISGKESLVRRGL